mgnify:CR=1 FL=1
MLTECQIKGIIDYSLCTNLKINCFLQQLQQQQPQLQPLQQPPQLQPPSQQQPQQPPQPLQLRQLQQT